jgi:hypothetical protein
MRNKRRKEWRIYHVAADSVFLHVKWLSRHRDMARPQVADGGDGISIWRVASNILNKVCQIADKTWCSSLEVGRGLIT